MIQQSLSSDMLPALDQAPSVETPFDDIASVYSVYEQRIFRFLLLSIRDRDVALSLTQDTFLRAWTSRASFRGDCSIYTWLMRIAVNLLRDHTRTQKFRFWRNTAATAIDVSEITDYVPNQESSAESRLITSEQMAAIWHTVSELTPRQRNVFLLRFVEELDLTDIAAVTGLPLSTVKTHLYRALAAVRAKHAGGGKEVL